MRKPAQSLFHAANKQTNKDGNCEEEMRQYGRQSQEGLFEKSLAQSGMGKKQSRGMTRHTREGNNIQVNAERS